LGETIFHTNDNIYIKLASIPDGIAKLSEIKKMDNEVVIIVQWYYRTNELPVTLSIKN
jgi:hypothetical protein